MFRDTDQKISTANKVRSVLVLTLALGACTAGNTTTGSGFAMPRGQCSPYRTSIDLANGESTFVAGEDGSYRQKNRNDFLTIRNAAGELALTLDKADGLDEDYDNGTLSIKVNGEDVAVDDETTVESDGIEITYTEGDVVTEISSSSLRDDGIRLNLATTCTED